MAVKQRMQWVDVLRGLAVYFIVVGHFTDLAGDFYLFVFSFHVQLFFFVSGLFASRYSGLAVKQLLQQLANRLLIPFAGLAVFHTLFLNVLKGGGLPTWLAMMLDCLKGVRNGPYIHNLWFFPCLAVMVLLYRLLQKVCKQRELLLVLCLALSFAMRLFKEDAQWIWSADSAVLYLFYYALGDYVKPFIDAFDYGALACGKKLLLWGTGAAASLFAAVWYTGYSNLKEMVGLQLPVAVDKLVMFFAAVVLIAWAAFVAVLLRRFQLLAEIGKNTMIISATEFISRGIVDELVQLVGLQLHYSQMRALLVACLFVAMGYKLWAPLLKKVFPAVFCREKDAPLFGEAKK
ncbi:MAG: acyltransferase family protein [Oscillospiraceae bacterium]|nr:acyltransferase family protein [Oscillospiraceae bacterium]